MMVFAFSGCVLTQSRITAIHTTSWDSYRPEPRAQVPWFATTGPVSRGLGQVRTVRGSAIARGTVPRGRVASSAPLDAAHHFEESLLHVRVLVHYSLDFLLGRYQGRGMLPIGPFWLPSTGYASFLVGDGQAGDEGLARGVAFHVRQPLLAQASSCSDVPTPRQLSFTSDEGYASL